MSMQSFCPVMTSHQISGQVRSRSWGSEMEDSPVGRYSAVRSAESAMAFIRSCFVVQRASFSFTAQVHPGCGATPVALASAVPWAVFLGQAGSFGWSRAAWALAVNDTVLLLKWLAILVAALFVKHPWDDVLVRCLGRWAPVVHSVLPQDKVQSA